MVSIRQCANLLKFTECRFKILLALKDRSFSKHFLRDKFMREPSEDSAKPDAALRDSIEVMSFPELTHIEVLHYLLLCDLLAS